MVFQYICKILADTTPLFSKCQNFKISGREVKGDLTILVSK